MLQLWHFIVHWIGGDYGAPSYGYFEPYDLLSGIAGLSLLGLLWSNLRKHNCEVHGCWRIGRHRTAAEHQVCRKHHPDDHLTADQVVAAHNAAVSS